MKKMEHNPEKQFKVVSLARGKIFEGTLRECTEELLKLNQLFAWIEPSDED